jgi:hypothetical protein
MPGTLASSVNIPTAGAVMHKTGNEVLLCERIRKAHVGRFRQILRIEYQRISKIWIRRRNPGVLVRKAPETDGPAIRCGHARSGNRTVEGGLIGKF